MCLEPSAERALRTVGRSAVVVHECVSRRRRRHVVMLSVASSKSAAASLDGEGGEGKSGEVMGHVSFNLMVWLFGRCTQANRQELQ